MDVYIPTNINTLRIKKLQLEYEIQTIVSKLWEKFKEETNESPTGIYIGLLETTVNGGTIPTFVVGEVEIDIKL